jgi:sporulation protein YlmC with PRC-barrel domain
VFVRDQLVEIGRLNWKKVDTSDGVTIGEVQGAEVETKSWHVTHVHVGLNDETLKKFGLRKPYLGRVLICLPVDTIRAVNEIITLKKTLSELKTNKECTEFSVK